jgi:hypothetical protein
MDEKKQMNNLDFTNTPAPSPMNKKSNILNVVIILLILALLAVIFFAGRGKNSDDITITTNENASSTTAGVTGTTSGVSVPVPTGAWTSGAIGTDISFDVPPNYYVSHPVIGSCRDVVSISTQTSSAPTIPIALIYKAGCVKDESVMKNYTHQEIKNGYVFQTTATNATVLSIFNQIVASAK